MKRYLYLAGIFTLVLLSFSFAQQQNEHLTITTYYPSPFGVYNEERLFPHDTPTVTCDGTPNDPSNNREGWMYYSNNLHLLLVCHYNQNTGQWGWLPSSSLWDVSPTNPNDIFNINTGGVAIGTNSAGAAKLLVSDQGDLLARFEALDGLTQLQLSSGHNSANDVWLRFLNHVSNTELERWRFYLRSSENSFRIKPYNVASQKNANFIFDNPDDGGFLTRIGIGTTDPDAGLEIDRGTDNSVPALLLRSDGPGWGSGIQFLNQEYPSPPKPVKRGSFYGIYADNIGALHFSDNYQQADVIKIEDITIVPTHKLVSIYGDAKINGDANITGNADIGGTAFIGWEHVVRPCANHYNCDAPCSTGKKVLGGGCAASVLFPAAQVSRPTDDGAGWHCQTLDIGGAWITSVYAICARVDN